ncbi:MAG TPA: efflux RND transporter periplasmic adaptor subunit [Polyangia bacterium]|jgi:RND family efflux transporter MFP subunit|nr:efflux RND transporter periplasmic adaptor subunit [Polyangia bacterium]HWE29009.1 efflux RND transporter periplasmic adaptor subunit [Polyangia bacterium]
MSDSNSMGAEPHARTSGAPDVLPEPDRDAKRLRVFIIIGVVVLLAGIVALYWHAAARTNHVALTAAPKPVSTFKAVSTTFRPIREYVGTLQPWNAAKVGPQFLSAYVGTVLVRPGAVVTRGEVLATLDCRNADAASREIAAQARGLQEQQRAIEHEAQRTQELKSGGFASENEIEQLTSRSAADQAKVESMRASLTSRTLEVNDCVLRAPFAGEVAERFVDPGAYVRPGEPVVTVVDRNVVRVVADAPEDDFDVVGVDTPVAITVDATKAKLTAKVSRRSPAADEMTRTVHFEIDLGNEKRALPVGTTARLTIEVGAPEPATRVPLRAATMRGKSATVFVVDGDVAKKTIVPIIGERSGALLLSPTLAGGTPVVVEGRALLDDGDRVAAKPMTAGEDQ